MIKHTTFEREYGLEDVLHTHTPTMYAEVTEDDKEDIREQIIEYIKENEERPPEFFNACFSDALFASYVEVKTSDYISDDEVDKILKELK